MTISMNPGHTQLARMPSAAKSRASVPVSETIAALETLYAASSAAGLRPAIVRGHRPGDGEAKAGRSAGDEPGLAGETRQFPSSWSSLGRNDCGVCSPE